jgi:hypothetical protein
MLLLEVIFYIFAVGLPNLMFYGWIVWFGVYAVRHWRAGHSKIKAAAFGVVAILPLVWFSADFVTGIGRVVSSTRAVRDAAAMPQLANPPRTLVVHGNRVDWQDRLVEMGAFDEIYVTRDNKTAKVANARRAGCDDDPRRNVLLKDVVRARMAYLVCATETPASSYPRDGLHFFADRRNSSGMRRHEWMFEYELKWIEGESETRIGYFGRVRHTPFLPPILIGATFMTSPSGTTINQIAPWHGEAPFLLGRLGLKPEQLKPAGRPSPEEVRNEYLRLRDSDKRADQVIAGMIAATVGSAALSVDDIAPVLASDVIVDDFASELGFQQFCNRTDRLCDFPDALTAVCKVKWARILESGGRRTAALRRCERISEMCDFCRVTPRCELGLTGPTAGCSQQEVAARDEVLRPLRGGKD